MLSLVLLGTFVDVSCRACRSFSYWQTVIQTFSQRFLVQTRVV